MCDKTHNLAFNVISRINWHYAPENRGLQELKVRKKIEYDESLSYEDNYRDLTEKELNAVISKKYPLRVVDADFDERAWPKEFEKIIDNVHWSVQLKPNSTIRDLLQVIKRMPFYGYWECKPPTLQLVKHHYMPHNDLVYVMKLRFGT